MKPKITNYKTISSVLNEEIGEIFLTSDGGEKVAFNHIEFKIFDNYKHYRNKGIMTKAVADYLKYCKEDGKNCLLAVVEKDNIASIRVLEKNNFIKFKEVGEYYTYIIDLRVEPDLTKKTIQEFFKLGK